MNKSQYWTTEIFQIEWDPMAMAMAEEQKSRLLSQKTKKMLHTIYITSQKKFRLLSQKTKKMSHTIYITSQQNILLSTIRIQRTF